MHPTPAPPPSILVVDDEAPVRQTIRRMLEHHGYLVEEASTGAQALAAVAAEPPDLVLLDLRLPDRNGLEILRDLSAHGYQGQVVLVTGYGTPEAFREAGELGACAVAQKSFTVEQLGALVSGALASAPTGQEADRVVRHIDRHLKTIQGPQDVAAALTVSVRSVSRHVKQVTGMSFRKYLLHRRIAAAEAHLRNPDFSIAEVAYEVGFRRREYLSRALKKARGVSPSEYRRSEHADGTDGLQAPPTSPEK